MNNKFSYFYENTSCNYTDTSYSYQNTKYRYNNNSYSYQTTTYKYSNNQNTNNYSNPHRKTHKNPQHYQKYPETQPKKQDESRLIQKIFKFLNYQDKNQIKNIINMVNSKQINLQHGLFNISNIVTPIMFTQNINRDSDRQNWIANQILTYITTTLQIQPSDKLPLCNEKKQKMASNELKIVDIGGGNGNVLREINSAMKTKYNIQTKPENFICVETKSDWVENYAFDNESITYSFWDNESIPIESESVDIVLCMVSLHHMSDETIQTTIKEIRRILKPGGHVLIKEHDASCPEALRYIEWEHHLYHILDEGYERKIVNAEKYLNEHIDNFKSKEFWKTQFQTNGFVSVERTNRCLETGTERSIYDANNVTNLYWEIYRK